MRGPLKKRTDLTSQSAACVAGKLPILRALPLIGYLRAVDTTGVDLLVVNRRENPVLRLGVDMHEKIAHQADPMEL